MSRAAFALVLALPLGACRPAPDFGPLPEFRLVAQDGRPFSKADMKGRTWVVDFIFTSCSGPCPALSERMKKLQDQFPKIGLLSVSVDPATDTPPVLKAYGERFGADFSRWRFVTGAPEEVRALVVGGFRLVAQTDAGASSGARVTHSTKAALVDGGGRVRGYYDLLDPQSFDELARRL